MLGKGYMYRNLRNYSSYSKILSAFNSPIFEEGYGAFKITLIAQKRMADKEYKNEWKVLVGPLWVQTTLYYQFSELLLKCQLLLNFK